MSLDQKQVMSAAASIREAYEAKSPIAALRNSYNMEIDDEQVDVVAELESRLEESTSKYNDIVEQMIEVREAKEKADLDIAFKTISEDLTDTQVEKLRVLSEGVSYESVEEFTTKVEAIKTSYFAEQAPVAVQEDETDLLQEETAEEAEQVTYVDPSVARYAESLGRFAAK